MINTWNESNLHKEIKNKYSNSADFLEVSIAGKIVDIFSENQIIEIQTSNFGALRKKLEFLLSFYPVKVVFPLIRGKTITVINEDGEIIRSRKSPKLGGFVDVFNEILYIPDLFLNPYFSFEILQVDVEEIRCDDGKGSWRRKGISIKNRILKKMYPPRVITSPEDLFELLFLQKLPLLNSKLITETLNIKIRQAQKILNFFKNTGVITPVSKKGNRIIYKHI